MAMYSRLSLSPTLTHTQLVATRTLVTHAPGSRPRVVILGSGWGGYQVLKSIDKKHYGMLVC